MALGVGTSEGNSWDIEGVGELLGVESGVETTTGEDEDIDSLDSRGV